MMKKILCLFCLFIVCTAFKCDDEPLEGEFVTDLEMVCAEAELNAAENALTLLNATDDNYTAICTQYKDAVLAQIEACGDATGTLQAIIDEIGDCTSPNDGNQSCVDAIASKNQAEDAFNTSTDANYTETCNALKEAIQNVISVCGTTVELQNQLDSLGNCILTTDPMATGQITVTAGTLDVVFDEITVEIDGANLKVTGETSAQNDYMIYFEVEEGETGNDVINTEFIITFTSNFTPVLTGFGNFVSNISSNPEDALMGTFSGLVRNDQNADLNLTSGVIDIEY